MNTTTKMVYAGVLLFWLVIILAMLSLQGGCATITAGDFTYTRIGNQHIEGRVVTPEGWIIELKQDSKTEIMEQALNILGYAPK